MHLVHPIYYIVYSCVGVRIRVRMWVRYHTASHLSRSFLLLILGTENFLYKNSGILNVYPGYRLLSYTPPFLKYDWLKNCIISHNHLLYSRVTFVLENFSRFEKLYRILVFRTLNVRRKFFFTL